LAGTVITADAMHAQRDHAAFIVEERHGDYLMGVKSNQPNLLDALESLPGGSFSP
jgi:predicted transposase YbfD/YdcC